MRSHPFPMTARFRDLLVVTYAFPAPILEPLVPSALTLDHHQGDGFVAIALVDMAAYARARSPPPSAWTPGSSATASSCAPSQQ